jgi:hypothetical protein
MSITHTLENGRLKSRRRVSFEPKPQSVDTANLRREMRLSKDAGHSMMKIHHCHAEKLFEAYEMLHGKPEDLRRTFGE